MHLRITRFLEHIGAGGFVGVPLQKPNGTQDDMGEMDVMINPGCAEDDAYEEEVTSIAELCVELLRVISAYGKGCKETDPVRPCLCRAVPLEVVYGSSEQLLDYHRVSQQSRRVRAGQGLWLM